MEQVHGVDVSWMTQGSPKDKISRKPPSPPVKTPAPAQPQQTTQSKPTSAEPKPAPTNGHPQANLQTASVAPTPAQAPTSAAPTSTTNGPSAPASRRRSRSSSTDKSVGPNGTPPSRRNSWFSNISAKFSSSHNEQAALNTAPESSREEEEGGKDLTPSAAEQANYPPVPKVNVRSAVLPPAAKPTGNGPYIPAPPRGNQAGFLGVFRRLSSSGANNASSKVANGLVERRVLNVDKDRQRCPIPELKDAKLRKVSFCVDVEIAPMPKYADADVRTERAPVDATQKKKFTEKGEGEALKHPKAVGEKKETGAPIQPAIESVPSEPKTSADDDKAKQPEPSETGSKDGDAAASAGQDKENQATKKKEKKKKSEEERKARKEKKRKLAETNGSIPMEIYYDSSDSSVETPNRSGTPRSQSLPTTNPVRIYRRCCQLRETPILKKITEQLLDPANSSTTTGTVNKLDLTGYWLQFADVVTLGDYLAVVPVREVILENSNLNDEGLRMILAGLLCAKRPDTRRRRLKHDPEKQGGLVERVVIKNNKIGPDGWKHLSLFLYRCRSLKYLDVSHIPFPRQAASQSKGTLPNGKPVPRGIAEVFSRALSERIGGSALELLNIGETEPTMDQFGTIMDSIIKSGVKRLGVAHNHIDKQGVGHIARYLAVGICEGLDLGGNDLTDHIEELVSSIKETDPLWALSLSGCNLKPTTLCRVLPTLSRLSNFRFIDLSHNHDLFQSTPSAVGLLRRYLPKMEPLKRIHLQDVGMTSEQAIALVEVLPESQQLAHINLLENAELVKLADATTEEAQEEACALYASLMAATRLSKSLICVDIEVPSDQSGDIVKAMAKQVVAYCLRNMERIPESDIGSAVASAISEIQAADGSKPPQYPDVLVHLVGHDVLDQSESDGEGDPTRDEDYVIGGTGVVKALACCLKNRGDESRRQSAEFIQELEDGEVAATPRLVTGGKAKDMSKHLLAGARKIRHRIQPALNKARANPGDEQNLRKLMFLDNTLQGIIKRFEDEFPDTRESVPASPSLPPASNAGRTEELSSSPPIDDAVVGSDAEDEIKIPPAKPLSRSSSVLSKLLAEEEGRVLRAGHRFRSGFFTQENIDLLTSIDDIGADPKHQKLFTDIAEEIGGEFLERVKEKGAVRTFKEDREMILRSMKAADPDHWDNFLEAQKKARANITAPNDKPSEAQHGDENAISDEQEGELIMRR